MKERPILFSDEMVRAILDGRKTQTRRVIAGHNRSTLDFIGGDCCEFENLLGQKIVPTGLCVWCAEYPEEGAEVIPLRYGGPGDRLWVRETCNISLDKDAVMYLDYGGKLSPSAPPGSESWARAWKTCPSIHMPRWASRITLEIVGVRVERVQDISEEDAEAEGIFMSVDKPYTAKEAYRRLWDSINAKRGFGWEANPWVWVVEFRKHDN